MYGLGVDLGTSFTAAATASAWALDMAPLAGQAVVTPSVAYLDEKGALLTGEAADRLGLQDPSRAAREFKRRLGDPTPVILDGAPYSPTALMAALLRSVVDTVSQAQGGPPDRIVLTHPAVWGPYRREQFAGIPHLAGLPRPQAEPGSVAESDGPTVITITEPVAAATYYCSTQPLPPDGLLAVYDLGGGTFDSAVVRNGRDGLEIIGTPEGIEWLGGADFDQAIMDHVDRQLDGAITALDPTDPGTASILATLQRDCMLAKEALSSREQADITVPLPGSVRHVTVTRKAFEQMITPSVETTMETFRRTLTAAGITLQDLTAVLLVGGSSQIPLVTQLLRDTLRRPILINTHPKHAVALGAAMLSTDTHTAHGIPAPRRRKPAAPARAAVLTGTPPAAAGHDSGAPATTAARAGAAPTAAERDSGAPAAAAADAAAAVGTAAPKPGRGAKHRAQPPAKPERPASGPAGDTRPAAEPTPTRRWRSRLTDARFIVALIVSFSVLGVAFAFGNAPSDQPQVPSANTATNAPSNQPQVPSATAATKTPSNQPQKPSATAATKTPSNQPQKPSATPKTNTPSKRPMLKLEDVQVHKPSKLATVRPAVVGAEHLVDRSPVFTSLPDPLTGAVLIPGASDDKRLTSPADYLVFDVARDATVYVAFDRRGAPELYNWWPAWLNQQGFKRTDMIIPTNDKDQRYFVVFAKKVPAGRVTLGPNAATTVYSTGYITLLTAIG
ncbi:Hsp70 family protein [Micromonospora sp. DR5-3]|uniref:Hsp70 family protein n=1 Tax=unclassified Micromonospora TaxID=2617518 RepID=UPI0011D54339|nr:MULTISPECIES: Hsp70 family protein [unclassified Micromonospora]MCW3817609.1 Hsp70 family protein [Micromonospora sp. DR5-3]TYC22035.1 Hsp70 family protein [Micromonospora sp. MP36]